MAQPRHIGPNLGGILQRALAVSLRDRSLWLWALLSALPGTALQLVRSDFARDPGRMGTAWGILVDLEPGWLAIGTLDAAGILLLAILAEGALIAGANDALNGGSGASILDVLRYSLSRLRAIVALRMLLFMGVAAYLSPLLLFLLFVGRHTARNGAVSVPPLLAGAGLLWLVSLIPALLWWYGIGNYAMRGCVLRREGSIRAIAAGNQVLRRNVRTSLLATVVAAAGQMLFGLVFASGLLALVRPAATLASSLDNGMGQVLTVGVAVFFIMQAAIIGLAQVAFVQVFWTAVYQALAPRTPGDEPVVEGQ